MSRSKDKLWRNQSGSLRDPLDIVSSSFKDAGVHRRSVHFETKGKFVQLLEELKITLLVSREYENLLVALNAKNKKINQSFLPLPHPSGIAVDRKNKLIYVAGTRNPNQIVELILVGKTRKRLERKSQEPENIIMPARVKYYPGCYYFHDLAMIGNDLYANSVGMNGVVKVDLSNPIAEELAWFPKCIEDKKGEPDIRTNFIQLNSIAAGKTIQDSFFTASGDQVSSRRPGHLNYPVKEKGVVFSGTSREVIARGLTRPHSAKLYKGKIWVNNSGYGEFGYIEKDRFVPVVKLEGWTRGLCMIDDIALIGVSRVIPKFSRYAPGITMPAKTCGVFAFSIKTNKILGSIVWGNGNQIFGIDYLEGLGGFLHRQVHASTKEEQNIFYQYK